MVETGQAVIGSLATTSDRDALYRRYKWAALLGVSFCYLFYYTGRQTFGFAIPGIQKELGLSKEMLGWVSAAWTMRPTRVRVRTKRRNPNIAIAVMSMNMR